MIVLGERLLLAGTEGEMGRKRLETAALDFRTWIRPCRTPFCAVLESSSRVCVTGINKRSGRVGRAKWPDTATAIFHGVSSMSC